MRAAGAEFAPKIVGFLCNWCCYGGADLAGVSRFQYPPHMRVIRLMCSGRMDLAFIFRAFAKGADGVFIGGCHLNDCHYVTEGNYDALGNSLMAKRILEKLDVHPDRLRLEWVSAGEGIRFAEIMNDLSAKVKALGPLGKVEGLEAAIDLVPYIKLVERERLRVPQRTEHGYRRFFGSKEFEALFNELVIDKLAMARIMGLVRKKPLSPAEICSGLKLEAASVAKHLDELAEEGLIRLDENEACVTTR